MERLIEHRVGSEKELLALCQYVEPLQGRAVASLSWDQLRLALLANEESRRYGYQNWKHALDELEGKWIDNM